MFSFSFYSTINEEITAMKVFYSRVKSPAKLLLIRGFMGMAWVFNLWMETSNKSWVFNLWVVEEISIDSLPFLCLFSLLFFLLLGIIVFTVIYFFSWTLIGHTLLHETFNKWKDILNNESPFLTRKIYIWTSKHLIGHTLLHLNHDKWKGILNN